MTTTTRTEADRRAYAARQRELAALGIATSGRDFDGGELYQKSGSPLFGNDWRSTPAIKDYDELEALLTDTSRADDDEIIAIARAKEPVYSIDEGIDIAIADNQKAWAEQDARDRQRQRDAEGARKRGGY